VRYVPPGVGRSLQSIARLVHLPRNRLRENAAV
jgi:hypothetical protein